MSTIKALSCISKTNGKVRRMNKSRALWEDYDERKKVYNEGYEREVKEEGFKGKP